MKKWIWLIVSVLVIGGFGFQWYSSTKNSKEDIHQTRTATAQKGKLEVKVSGSGTVEAVTSKDIKAVEDNDEIDEVLVSVGDNVSKGDELITFTDGSDPITASVAGTITDVSVDEGDRVQNGTVLVHLKNYSNLQTVIQVDELDVMKVKKGQQVSLQASAFPDDTFSGKVTKVAKEGNSENGTTTFDVTISIQKPKELKVGMTMEASIVTESKADALYVPSDAIYSNGDKKYVHLISDKNSENDTNTNFEEVAVQVGLVTDEYVEITDGVSEGNMVELPQLSTESTSTNKQENMMKDMNGMPGGGMPPSNGQGRAGGRGGMNE
ncbi:efflux RND transporter periplasmic adaptor subunit [Virgibacillus soli]|uniref:efflux RND transporter periplasmic adaptor subunit n=1 Tax=Paracerasibacillus soli TaxID=480284 RepID=UPI0035F0F24A